MSIPLALLKFAARAGLNVVGFGVAGDFAVEVLPSIVTDVWKWWARDASPAEVQQQVQAVANLSDQAARQAAERAVREEATGQPEEVQLKLISYLAGVPAAIRQSQRSPADPSGKTVTPTLSIRKADDLLPLFPSRLPRFKAGDPAPGFPDWTLAELLGLGGFGEVWRADNPHLPSVALKFCLDASAARTLRNEAELLGRVATFGRHPGIVTLLDTALASDPPCLKYEYVPGGDLAALIQQWHAQPVPTLHPQVTGLMADLAAIVSFAHRLSPPIVHRDLKPANILVQNGESGKVQVRVADFGIGGVATRRAREDASTVTSRGLFLTSALRGSCTPLYASPQQMRGEDPDPRDDVYSLGVIWMQLLTGDLTTGATPDWRDELADRKVPDDVVSILAGCLAHRPEKRPADAAVLAERIAPLLPPPPRPNGTTEDPSRVLVKEYNIAPLQVVLDAEPVEEAELPGLPGVPLSLRELEGRLAGIEKALEQLEQNTHPALESARLSVEESERQARQLEADLAAHIPTLESGQREALVRAVARDPRGPIAPLLDLAPQMSTKELLPYIHRLRNVERARLARGSARQQYATLRQQEIDALRRNRGELRAQLRVGQNEDLESILRAFFAKVGPTDEFPLQAWMQLEGLLEQRRGALSSKQLLSQAEQAFETFRRFGDIAPPKEIVNSIGIRLVAIPPGRFLMGAPPEEKGRRPDEGPRHEVTISRAIYFAAHPVTQDQYATVMGLNPSHFAPAGAGRDRVQGIDTRTFPVDSVSWEEAATFCKRLSERASEKAAGRAYRLPTEAEWEYACRAGATTAYPHGETLSSLQANFNGQNPGGSAPRGPSLGRTTAVGAFAANAWGLFDMLGNVWEWCHDFYSERAYPAGAVTDPVGPISGSAGHVLRGGAWDVGGELCRCASRNVYRAGWDRCFGFRVVLIAERRRK
jgi:formylglycine-generating enzyme required for sulfatase activity/serine/threonine protein kinase